MNRIILLLLISISFVVGCTSTTPIATPAPSLTPSVTPNLTFTQIPSQTPTLMLTVTPPFTPTLTNVPLISHDWQPAPILITYDSVGGYLCDAFCVPGSPPFILYGDGNLFVYTSFSVNDNFYGRYLHKKLDQSQVCRILNTIDQTGFLDFDPNTYSVPGVTDALNWRVQVYAWRNKDVSLYALGDWADILNSDLSRNPSDTINPASIRDTFALLYNYPVEGLDVYIPKLLVLWIWKSSVKLPYTKDWTVDNVSLAKLYKKAGAAIDTLPRPVYFNGKDAEDIYAMFDNSDYYGEVTQNGISYGISVSPVLPFEKISGDSSVIIPDATQMKLPSLMRCSPSDGTMPIPPYGSK